MFFLIMGGSHRLHLEASCTHEVDQSVQDHLLRVASRWSKGLRPLAVLGFRPRVRLLPKLHESLRVAVRHTPGRQQDAERASSPKLTDDAPEKAFSAEELQHLDGLAAEEKAQLLSAMRAARCSDGKPAAPLKLRLLAANLPQDVKRKILQRLEKQRDTVYNGEAIKYTTWVESMIAASSLKALVPLTLEQAQLMTHLLAARQHLDAVFSGHRTAKQAILERFFNWLKRPLLPQRPLALKGCPGNGKTSLIKDGLAAIMGRPFSFIALGGALDSSYLLGHAYTYEGSCQGRLADALVSANCKNPVILFDELDKCSTTPKGEEIVNALLHVTDGTQNSAIRDRYLAGLDVDVSQALLIFSFNDEKKVSPVLLDRLQVVPTDEFSTADQVKIVRSYLLPKVLVEHGLPASYLRISTDGCKEAVECYRKTGGVRLLRSALEQVVAKVCIFDETQGEELLTYPLTRAHLRRTTEGGFELLEGAFLALSRAERRDEPALRMYV